jgi:hypothetical protein
MSSSWMGLQDAFEAVKEAFFAGAMREVENLVFLWITAGVFEVCGGERRAASQLFAGGGAGLATRKNGVIVVGAGVRDSVADDADVFGEKLFGVGAIVAGEDDAEVHFLHAVERARAGTEADGSFEPFG